MKSQLSSRLHLITWCVAIILTIIPSFSHFQGDRFVGNIIATLFWMAVYYLFFLYLAPNYILTGKVAMFFGVSVIAVIILPFMGYTLLLLSRALFNGSFSEFYKGYTPAVHFSGLKAMVMAGLFGSLFRMICVYSERKA
jgi:hypothetical protein